MIDSVGAGPASAPRRPFATVWEALADCPADLLENDREEVR